MDRGTDRFCTGERTERFQDRLPVVRQIDGLMVVGWMDGFIRRHKQRGWPRSLIGIQWRRLSTVCRGKRDTINTVSSSQERLVPSISALLESNTVLDTLELEECGVALQLMEVNSWLHAVYCKALKAALHNKWLNTGSCAKSISCWPCGDLPYC